MTTAEPEAPLTAESEKAPRQDSSGANSNKLVDWVKKLVSHRESGEDSLREVLEEYIEEMAANPENNQPAVTHELTLLSNILDLRDRTAEDVMIPRADIIAIDINTSPDVLLDVLAEKTHSRIPVYRETLDDIIGIIHIKDVIEVLAKKKPLIPKNLVREAQIVSPALPVFDLLILMRQTKQQMVFVVDEYGGIDGLVTIGDVISSIVGEVQDEFDRNILPEITETKDGGYITDARIEIAEFEEKFGQILSDDEREVADTLGGFIFTLTGRIPARGEVIIHPTTNFRFEILDADQRRVLRILVYPPVPPSDPS